MMKLFQSLNAIKVQAIRLNVSTFKSLGSQVQFKSQVILSPKSQFWQQATNDDSKDDQSRPGITSVNVGHQGQNQWRNSNKW